MPGVPFFIEVVSGAQNSNVQLCRKMMAFLFKERIAPLPFAATAKEISDVLLALKGRGLPPAVFVINALYAEDLLPQADLLIGPAPVVYLRRRMFTDSLLQRKTPANGTPALSTTMVIERMTPRLSVEWNYGSQTADDVAATGGKALIQFLKTGDFGVLEYYAHEQALTALRSRIDGDDDMPRHQGSVGPRHVGRPSSATVPVRAPAAPAPPPAPAIPKAATAAFNGTLDQLGLSTLLSMLDAEKRSGDLVLSRGNESGRLAICKGRVLQAAVNGLCVPAVSKLGIGSVQYLLNWQEGRFEFSPRAVNDEDQLKMSMTELLLECARRHDEPKKAPSPPAGMKTLSAAPAAR